MVSIRPYEASDFPLVESWWLAAGELAPLPGMMPVDSSFICLINDIPALAVSLYLTNTPEVCYVENFVGNPSLKGEARRQASLVLANHIGEFARQRGYLRLFCLADKACLKTRYEELGWTQTLDGVATFIKNL